MISGLVLAAGMSTRMGSQKALLDWGGEPLIAYQVKQLREAGCDEVIVVLGHQADRVHRNIRRLPCRVMLNPRYHSGRSGSLRIGAKAVNRDADMIVVVNVDQPCSADRLRALIAAHRPDAAATRPIHDGRHGHPVVVSGRLRPEMLAVTDEQEGLREILGTHAGEVYDIPADDRCLLDVNTPEDYSRARQRLGLNG